MIYAKLKNLVLSIFPRKVLFKYEGIFRGIIYQFYRGSAYYCNVCNRHLKSFIKISSGDLLCPACGSLGRSRRLYLFLEKDFLRKGNAILDFSPPRPLYRKLKKKDFISYYPTDYEDEFLSDYRFDIADISLEDNFLDVIICYHILEHVEEDRKAMAELYRVLKPGGTVIIQTPFKDKDIYENPKIRTKEDRLKHFGQEDHVRIYSVDGLNDRLINAGFSTDIRKFDGNKFLGFSANEIVIFAKK